MTKWEIVLAGAIVPITYGTETTTAKDVKDMILARKGELSDTVSVRPEAVLAVVKYSAAPNPVD